jgi:hypothetical protein
VRLSLGSDNAYTSFNHQHGIAATSDTVHAVWFDARHGWPNAEIYYRRSLDGGATWEAESKLTDDAIYSGYPSIAADGATLHVVYFSSENEDDNIHYLRSTDAGATWAPDAELTSSALMQDFPSVAAAGSNVHVIYHDEQNGNWEVYYRRSTDAGTTWDPEVRLTNDPGWSNNSGILVSGQDVHVIWSDDRASTAHFDIYYKRSTDNGTTWSADARLTNTFDSGAPSPAMSGQNIYVGFQSERDGNTEMFFKRSTNSGADWLADVQLTDDPAMRQLPAIAASGFNVHMVWQDHRASTLPEIYYKRSTDLGATWEPDMRLTNDPLRSIWTGVTTGDSIVHVLWCDDRPGLYNVYYKRNTNGNPTGTMDRPRVADCMVRRFAVLPNPFRHYGQVVGCDSDSAFFAIHDIAGRRISQCRGGRIGQDLTPGVYFLVRVSDGRTARFVKIGS